MKFSLKKHSLARSCFRGGRPVWRVQHCLGQLWSRVPCVPSVCSGVWLPVGVCVFRERNLLRCGPSWLGCPETIRLAPLLCVSVHVCICMCMSMCMHACMCMCRFSSMSLYTCVCVCLHVRLGVVVFMYEVLSACVCVCMCMSMSFCMYMCRCWCLCNV